MTAWLTVIGLGEDGLDGISPAARALIDGAELLVGGQRHLSKVPDNGTERLSWKGGFHEQVGVLEKHKDKRVVVLASGDPFCYGVGSVLARHYEADEIFTVPAPGAFSLAASRMGWSLPDLESLTIHGRPLEALNRFLFSGLRLLVLSRDGDSPAEVAALLTARGFGPSSITVLEHLGGDLEKRLDGTASDWKHTRAADLNTLAIDCRAEAG
ncbi:MAG: precorrin-6y C5,15-methyltransferase (decarboxylating) subunit CbiE, partial [Rhodospirillales bacterium]|nr:precorrin-6y C5,15-methyltransferase (decarboxylating) subunit CbiE [Rhodospirillales bacterium]